jgi:hypothetical protein
MICVEKEAAPLAVVVVVVRWEDIVLVGIIVGFENWV